MAKSEVVPEPLWSTAYAPNWGSELGSVEVTRMLCVWTSLHSVLPASLGGLQVDFQSSVVTKLEFTTSCHLWPLYLGG